MNDWHEVSNPILPHEELPAERKVVLVWLRQKFLPFCGYIRYASGDKDCPNFIVYHGNTEIGADVTHWCDCLPKNAPPVPNGGMYEKDQVRGRGYPARSASPATIEGE